MSMPGTRQPTLSVVIPTFNRRERLHRVLTAIACQSTTTEFEVVVVSDGSTDGTDDYLRSGDTPVPVVAVIQPNAGPGAARNAGILASSGDIVLFVDDDVIPAPDLVEQHLHAHLASLGRLVVIGPMLTPSDAVLSPWVAWEQHQLYKQYDAMRTGEWECTFRQFYTGNASVPRQSLIDVGLFDVTFRRAEDVELAFRLDEAGLSFRFVPEARGFHYAERGFDSWLATAGEYGRNDVVLMDAGQRWLSDALPRHFADRNVIVRLLTRLVVPRPRLAAATTSGLASLAVMPLSRGVVQRQLLSGLYNLTYYRGVADALGSSERFLRVIQGIELAETGRLRAAFVLEQTLGHITHSDNLRRLISASDVLMPSFLPVAFEFTRASSRIPGYGNWTIRAGIRARNAIRRQARKTGIDVMFIHTQVPAILAGRWMRKIPTVVSLDATPAQYDQMGDHYAHAISTARVERWKRRIHARSFRRARHLVTWSKWTRDDLVDGYGVPIDKISVISPGVDVEKWDLSRSNDSGSTGPVRILFVGGDFERKGGLLLLEAARRLRSEIDVPDLELHVVTRAEVPSADGLVVHDKLMPNSPQLIGLYHLCDVFCLPTLGDCLPMVLAEAAASSLAVVSTDVGAIHELVRNDETGILVAPGDVEQLTVALRRLVTDPSLRARLGAAAHREVLEHHDAAANARRLVELLVDVGRDGG